MGIGCDRVLRLLRIVEPCVGDVHLSKSIYRLLVDINCGLIKKQHVRVFLAAYRVVGVTFEKGTSAGRSAGTEPKGKKVRVCVRY